VTPPTFAFGDPSETAPLRTVLVRHARDAWPDTAAIDREWRALGYAARPNRSRALVEYDRFLDVLHAAGAEVRLVPREPSARQSAIRHPPSALSLDSLYLRDAGVVCQRGVVLARMGKPARAAEPAALEAALAALGVPICGRIGGSGRLEGGDVVRLAPRIVAVGQGYRTNAEGIRQLAGLLDGLVDDVLPVPLPHWRGPDGVFHLMSMISPLDRDLALVYAPLLPVSFRERLQALGIELVEVPDAEFESLGCNALALGPRRCLLVAGNPTTRARLERAGCEVREFAGAEICHKGGGGPTCLTLPLARG
jgi:N-dimethylarginine dimethylaminohydrolase